MQSEFIESSYFEMYSRIYVSLMVFIRNLFKHKHTSSVVAFMSIQPTHYFPTQIACLSRYNNRGKWIDMINRILQCRKEKGFLRALYYRFIYLSLFIYNYFYITNYSLADFNEP